MGYFWLPYGAVAIIALMTIVHFARTWRQYAEGIPLLMAISHCACLAMLTLLASETDPTAWSLGWIGGFALCSMLSALLAEADRTGRQLNRESGSKSWEYRSRSYHPVDGFAALLFVIVAIIAAHLLS